MKSKGYNIYYFIFLIAIVAFGCTKENSVVYQINQKASKDLIINNEDISSNKINILCFNLLAPCWADPSYYPASSTPLLNRIDRRRIITNLLKAYQNKIDVFALQEVAQSEFNFIQDALQETHIGFQANHDPGYWSSWITPANPWELNGNAIFVNKYIFTNINFEDFPSSKSGNHSALFTGTFKNQENKNVRIASVHLDSDYPYNRKRELNAVLSKWQINKNYMDIIAGDFNTETDATNIQIDLKKAGYNDLLKDLGKATQTHPWSSKYYGSENWGIIDHIMYRNGNAVEGSVVDHNLFNLYPNDEEKRININLQKAGSDHFQLIGTIAF